MKSPVFLVSTGRTGTKFFAGLFAEHCTDVASYHTTKHTRLVNILGNMSVLGWVSRDALATIWRSLKYDFIKSHRQRYIECNPYYNALIDIIGECFPGARFVYVVRAARSCVISHMNWERQRVKSRIANRLVPFWQPMPYGEHLKGWLHNYHQRAEFYCKIWAQQNAVMWESVRRNDRAMMIKFEDVFDSDDGIELVTHMMNWLEMELRKPIRSATLRSRQNESTGSAGLKWDQECDRVLEANCAEVMGRLGYQAQGLTQRLSEL
jgi:hypothetical protein